MPAGIVGRTVSFVRGEQLPTDPADSPTEWVETGAVAAPGRAVQIIAPFHNVSLSHADWRDIVTGSLPLSVYGAIRYETTPLFERVFGLAGLSELPRLDDLAEDDEGLRRRLEEVAGRRGA